MQVPTNVPTPSLCLSLDPTFLGNIGEGVQVKQARELGATITYAVGIMLPLSESRDVCTNPHAPVLRLVFMLTACALFTNPHNPITGLC